METVHTLGEKVNIAQEKLNSILNTDHHISFLHSLLYVNESYFLLYSKGFWWCIILGITVFFGLCPSSGILETRKRNVLETRSVSVLRWWEGEDIYVGSLRKRVIEVSSKGPNRVRVFLSSTFTYHFSTGVKQKKSDSQAYQYIMTFHHIKHRSCF
jgi:hypothetical protein